MSADLSVRDIKTLLQGRIADLAHLFAPEGKKSGAYWNARSPFRQDRNPSFTIWLKGGSPGSFKDWGDDVMKGDVIDLVAACACAASPPFSREARTRAILWAKDWLGLSRKSPEEIRTRARQASQARIERDQLEAAERLARENRAFRLWLEGGLIGGTLAETYYREARGVDIRQLLNMEASLRFKARLDHFEAHFAAPAVLACFQDELDRKRGVHVTWLARDGRGKCGDVDKPKMMFGSTKGLAIRLTKGASGLRVHEEVARGVRGPLAIAEGVETALSVAAAFPELRVWAAGSLGNIGDQVLPGCVSEVIVCADNDDGKPQATAALEHAIAKIGRQGRPVSVARPPAGAKDFNDLIRRTR